MTPDSFSDGGCLTDADAALARAERLVEQGADGLDLGAESTRPGYASVSVEEEWKRLASPLRRIRERYPGPISVDTQKAEIARRALAEGADIINDIWGCAKDPEMARVLAKSRAGLVLMFNRQPAYAEGCVELAEMRRWIERQIQRLDSMGMGPGRILVDPGLGFGMGVADNWTVVKNLQAFSDLGAGILLGPSRKRFLGEVSGRPPAARDVATAALCALAVREGVDVVRVHCPDVVKDALAVADRWERGHA